MDVPSTGLAIAAVVVFAAPGFIYAALRRWFSGENSTDRDSKLLFSRGLIFAVTLSAIYFLIFGNWLTAGLTFGGKDAVTVPDARQTALVVLVFYIVIPTAISLLLLSNNLQWLTPSKGPQWVRRLKILPHRKYRYTDVPTAWDHAIKNHQKAWVRIRRSDGIWVGGWFTGGSFATTYRNRKVSTSTNAMT